MPESITDICGVALIVVAIVIERILMKKHHAEAEVEAAPVSEENASTSNVSDVSDTNN